MSPYEQRAVQALSTPNVTVAIALKGIGWALLAMTEAIRPEPVEVVELTHGSEAECQSS